MNIKNSVHLQDFPNIENFKPDNELLDVMDKVRAICSCALYVRDKHNLRVRLPLNKMIVISPDSSDISNFVDIIADEINVKNIEFNDNIEEFGEKKLVLNFQKIGKKVGAKMPNVMKLANSGKWEIKDDLLIIDEFKLANDEYSIKLETKKENVFAVDGYDILIMLDLNITEELEQEGTARDLVRLIQQFRKDVKLDISDKISLVIKTNYDFLKDSINNFKEYIQEQTLSVDLMITKDELNTDFSFCEEMSNNIVQVGFSVIK
ncbi:MAG: hypothetical protein J6C50_01880 [Rickettsiales bacterium]|nr:hypothetical protein [Rickettsiales bacterium]